VKIGTIELTKESFRAVLIGAIVVCGAAVYFIAYMPLMRQLKASYTECRAIETDVVECRNLIASAEKTYEERLLMTEKHLSEAVDELTKHGKAQKVDFISMSPQAVRSEADGEYKVLPVAMEVEATYEKLGEFLGSLDALKKGVIKVESFDMTAGTEPQGQLKAKLVVDMYLSGRDDAE
jgi:Tfp pilus assembly protein PilO